LLIFFLISFTIQATEGRIVLRKLSFCAVLLCSTAFAQLCVKSQQAIQLSGIEEAKTIGDAVFVASDSTVAKLPVILITATTEAANITFEVSDKDRIPVEFDQLTADTILISTPGKSWVRIVAIDFDKNLYATKLLPVELGPSPTPPEPPDPPLPPDGPFDALAVRVAVIAAQMSASERDELSKLLADVIGKMERYDFRTLEQARDFVEKGWTNTVPAKQLIELLADDSKDRLLSWEQAQEYYHEVLKGLQ